jgi:hypothetical protein
MSDGKYRNSVLDEPFLLRVNEVTVRGLFGGKGTVTGTVLSGSVFAGDVLSVRGKKTKPYTVTAVSVEGGSVRPDVGATVRLEVRGIGKRDLTPSDVLLCPQGHGQSLLTDIYSYQGSEADYFAELFARYFPDYTIVRDASVSAPDGDTIRPEFLFYRGGTPCLAIFLRDNTEWKKKEVNYLQDTCRAQGIAALTFISNFANRADYVRGRVENELG